MLFVFTPCFSVLPMQHWAPVIDHQGFDKRGDYAICGRIIEQKIALVASSVAVGIGAASPTAWSVDSTVYRA
jgi:hypothetical protein